MKYVKVEWPEIQDYMLRYDYPEDSFYDPVHNVWFIPETWVEDEEFEGIYISDDIKLSDLDLDLL